MNIFFPIQTLVLCPIWGGGTEGDDCKLGKNVRKSRKKQKLNLQRQSKTDWVLAVSKRGL